MFRSQTEPVLIINSLYNISDGLLEALKLRTILNYKSKAKFDSPDIKPNQLKVEKYIKYNTREYDYAVLRYDSLFDAIYLNDDFFGFIEIYRENNFNTEDKN